MSLRIYDDSRYKRARRLRLKADEHLCMECYRYGKRVDAVHTHHIIPVDVWRGGWFRSDNLVSLCTGCHNKMHDRFSGELTDEGINLVKRLSPHRFYLIKHMGLPEKGEKYPSARCKL